MQYATERNYAITLSKSEVIDALKVRFSGVSNVSLPVQSIPEDGEGVTLIPAGNGSLMLSWTKYEKVI